MRIRMKRGRTAGSRLSDEQRAKVRLIQESGLFDAAFYLQANPDVAASGEDPIVHYLLIGAKQGLDPSSEFSSRDYLAAHPRAKASGANPLIHYIRNGFKRGLAADPLAESIRLIRESGLFDEDYYRFFQPEIPADTDPIRHYLLTGAREGADPSEAFSTTTYVRHNSDVATTGMNPLVHYLQHGRAEQRPSGPGRPRRPLVSTLLAAHWPGAQPLPVIHIPTDRPRVTVLTNSVSPSHLYGGVGTAVTLGIQLANELGATLRLATRLHEPDGRVVGMLQEVNGVTLDGPVELVHLPEDGSRPLPFDVDHDVVLTTSWWTTRAVIDSTIPRECVAYLLQEDERMFYPNGDQRLRCAELFEEDGFSVVVNTQGLLDHLIADGLSHLSEAGLAFEPAFPGAKTDPWDREDGRRRFFFYARPFHTRNLFWRGLEAIGNAVEQGILDTDQWDIYFVGQDCPDVELPSGARPKIIQNIPWHEYQTLVASMDAGLSLMDTPHPSYPPLDLAAAGAAVLTNRHGGKDLANFSRNIVMADLSLPSLVAGLRRVVELGMDDEARAANVTEDRIARDWIEALKPAVTELSARMRRTADPDVR